MRTKPLIAVMTASVLSLVSPAQFLEEARPLAPVSGLGGGGPVLLYDWDGNGVLDALLFHAGVRLFQDPLAGGSGPLTPPVVLAVASATWAGAVGNLNGDAYADLFTQDSPGYGLFARFGGPGGALAPPIPWASITLDTTRFGDLNGDGLLDFVFLPSLGTSTARAWLTQPGGIPGPAIILPFPGVGVGGAVADVDADGFDDIIRGGDPYVTATLEVIRGNPAGLPDPASVISLAPLGPGMNDYSPLAVGDLDGDGFDDVVIRSSSPPSQPPVSVLFGNPVSLLGDLQLLPAFPSTLVLSALIADFDQDGRADIAVATRNGAAAAIVLLRGVGSRAFSASTWTGYVTSGPLAFASGDLDNDGDPDLFLSRWPEAPQPGGYGVLRNEALVQGGAAGSSGPLDFGIGPAAPGSSNFAFTLQNALPASLAAIFVSLGPPASSVLAGPVVDFTTLFLPFGDHGLVPTDAFGFAQFNQPVPSDPAMIGVVVTAQWGVLDANGAFQPPFGSAVALSRGRTIVIF